MNSIQPFYGASREVQIVRLRELAYAALADYTIDPHRLTLLNHQENTTYRVDDSDGASYVLRIQRVTGRPWHLARSPAMVEGEMAWLSALRRDSNLLVPEPVPTRTGMLYSVAEAPGVPEPRICVLLRWLDGRFYNEGLAPAHLWRMGKLMAQLQVQGATFQPPPGFSREQLDDVSEPVVGAMLREAATAGPPADGETVAAVVRRVRAAQAALGAGPDRYGLIHGDLHQGNVLFTDREAAAIDFDDCGWAYYVYDLAVPLYELKSRPNYPALREALLAGYCTVRPLPPGCVDHLDTYIALRALHFGLWFLENRTHPSFPDWASDWADTLGELRAYLAANGEAT